MPSLDTIRTVTIKGQTDGVDQATAALNKLTASIAAANDNLSKSRAPAEEASEGFSITGEKALSAANHLRQAAEAAYAFSPAFRGVVNEMAVPVLAAAGTALEGVAAGLVRGTNLAGTGLISLAGAVEKTAPQLLGLTTYMRSAGIAMEAFAPTVGSVAGAVLSRLVPVVGQILLLYDAVKLLTAGWRLAGEQLETYNKISTDAVGMSTDFYQRITKAAPAVDDLTESLKKMNEQLTPKLGGSAGLSRLDELTKAGNFSGNAGVGQLKSATDTKEQLSALVTLLNQATTASQQLAAIDLARTIVGDKTASNLEKDYDYLSNIQRKAQEIAGADIISDADVARAVQIQARFDAAYKTLSERWKPLQDILTDLGMRFKMEWLSFLEAVAGVANALEKAYNWAARLAAVGFDSVKQGLRQAAGLSGSQFGPLDDSAGSAQDRALSALRSGLSQPTQVKNAFSSTKTLSDQLRPDQSKDPAKTVDDSTAAYDRATESVLKYIKVTEAASKTVSDSVAEQEKYRAIAQLTAAAEKDKIPITAALSAEMAKLGERAGAAAAALEKARVANEIRFGANTSLLSQDDVQIATRLKGLYPDVATALGSVEAQGMRANNAFKEIASTIESSLTSGLTDIAMRTTSVSDGFKSMGLAVVKALEQMIIKIAIVQPMMQALQSSVSSSGILGLLGLGGTGAAAQATSASTLANNTGGAFYGPGFHSGGIVGSEPTFYRNVAMSAFAGAPRFHTGGIAGDEVPIIAKQGEGVFTKGQMAAMGGGSTHVQTGDTHITIQGSADQTTLAVLKQELAKRDARLHSDVIASVVQGRKQRAI